MYYFIMTEYFAPNNFFIASCSQIHTKYNLQSDFVISEYVSVTVTVTPSEMSPGAPGVERNIDYKQTN